MTRVIDVEVEHSAEGSRVLSARDRGQLPPAPEPPTSEPCFGCPCCLPWLQSLECLRYAVQHHRTPRPKQPCPLGPDCLVCTTGADW